MTSIRNFWGDYLLIYLAMIDSEQDELTFINIYEKYRFTIMHTAMLILKDQYLAEDAVHNAFLKVIENLNMFNGLSHSKIKSLITIITKNKAIDILRKENGLLKIPIDTEDYLLTSDEPDPLEALISEQGYNILINCISKLNNLYKPVLELKYIYDYTDIEIARLLDITPQNVNMRIYRAKGMLREMIAREVLAVD